MASTGHTIERDTNGFHPGLAPTQKTSTHRYHAEVEKNARPVRNLVTGATGFLGSYVVRNLLYGGDEVYMLVRKESLNKARQLVTQMYRQVPGSENRVFILHGDIATDEVFEQKRDRDYLQNRVNTIWHLAGANNLRLSREQALKQNWRGAVNIFKLAEGARRLDRVNMLSSTAVSGDFEGVWREDMLEERQSFRDHYASSKYMADLEARRWSTRLPVAVFRPGNIVGDSKTGYFPKIDGPYHLFKIFMMLEKMGMKITLPIAPAAKHAGVNIVPVDYVANAITCIGKQDGAEGKAYHLTDPEPLSFGEFFETLCEQTGLGAPKHHLATKYFDPLLKAPVISRMAKGLGKLTDLPVESLAYTRKVFYDTTNTRAALCGSDIKCPRQLQYLPTILNFARDQLFPKAPLLPVLGNRSPRVL